MFTNKPSATASLRASASTISDEAQVFAVQSLADYLDATFDYFDHRMPVDERIFLGELAGAFRAGYDEATTGPSQSRSIGRAIRTAGLGI